MKIKNANLKWYVLYYDFNTDKVTDCNIFGGDFIEELHADVLKKKVTTFAELREYIRKWAMYHYWSKAEFEIAVGWLGCRQVKELEVVDIYRQILMNLDRITEYVNSELRLNFK